LNNIRIAIVIPYPIEKSGVVEFSRRLANELSYTCSEIVILCIGSFRIDKKIDVIEFNDPCALNRWALYNYFKFDIFFWMGLFESDDDLTDQLRVSEELNRQNIKVFLMWERTGFSLPLPSTDSRLQIIRAFNGVFPLNSEQYTFLSKIISKEKIIKISPGVDTQTEFYPVHDSQEQSLIRGEIGWPRDGFIISSIGRLTKRKQSDFLLKAWVNRECNLNLCYLAFVGSGFGQPDSVESYISDMAGVNKNIIIIPHQDFRLPYYQASDIFILAGTIEGEPSVLSEAMATGLPIVATAIPGHMSLVIPDLTGLLFAPGNQVELMSNICKLCKSKALREFLGKNSREKVLRERDIKVIAKIILNSFEIL
jgi:glycosyltransferase involved in cell wall biosynthesis